MKIDCRLDYSTILANQGRPVHLAMGFKAPSCQSGTRSPMAFCVVLDRSGSMSGEPLRKAKAASEAVVRNLHSSDQFALVAFDDSARVVVPMQAMENRETVNQQIRGIHEGGSTNLTGGWMLGRDELAKTAPGTARRVLLLSDGHLNVGVVNPEEVGRVVADGLERSRVRTSTLGFGDNYDENLMERLATCSGGNFYDANSADKLPAIFTAELDGLQRTSTQNLRIRFRPGTFCENWRLLAGYQTLVLPDGRTEIAVGDLVSEESATVILQLEVLPLPECQDGQPVASLEGEELAHLEILWDDLSGAQIKSCVHEQVVRILAAQDPADVKVNVDVIPGVVTQRTGVALEEARAEADAGRPKKALEVLNKAIGQLEALGASEVAIASLKRMVRELEEFGGLSARSSKEHRYRASHMRKMKSMSSWTLDEEAPGYSEAPLPPAVPPTPPQASEPSAGEDPNSKA